MGIVIKKAYKVRVKNNGGNPFSFGEAGNLAPNGDLLLDQEMATKLVASYPGVLEIDSLVPPQEYEIAEDVPDAPEAVGYDEDEDEDEDGDGFSDMPAPVAQKAKKAKK